ncbi:30S ribosomal protein S12 methylthiotransferase RimO [Blautia massiliensis]|uniref:30S ribosomal protein S12 methylthiotransferase RimO n=1 Tax=Blautia TaxID=572511 RepID=UPI000E51BA14|nr:MULTISPECIES: 30S ribosomal protein S12 methylthiotransferase RimO [Blautia]MCC2725604.1 30S ribosomal protein S12 methylthiotransferase RimO [Blautia sp. MSK22_86]NSF56728.1 30S ribosomal protein S12 methylthiotransferase RimO [Blautia massiliensis (ex Durand et al. 2017)]NSK72073.1 30S ribosomal protein S12 methylthiotransferase RimO [Blautia massiliensis (ex Durand et al. 2017)]RHP71316.1 30S ribosomal protein S12 methylthiotransferase RimO [Ruminococcus sp. OF02-6]
MKILFISLGCDKNLADSEEMLGLLTAGGHEITDDETQADAIVINTCCFIKDAKEESVETILEMAEYKKTGSCHALIVTGCMAQRYQKEIIEEVPEVDAVLGTTSYGDIVKALEEAVAGNHFEEFRDIDYLPDTGSKRVLTTGGHFGYLKIAEGCDKHCTYCIIPKLRGKFRSVPMERLIAQAEDMAEQGVKELILVAQETTVYGRDLYGKKSLHILLKKLCEIRGIRWIRILYCYPEEIYDELIETIRDEKKICHYLDIPIQHASDRILKRMGRRTSKQELIDIVGKLRREIPDIVLRTTLITGFPGETGEDHEELKEFVDEMEFDRLGVFTYSSEENTPAAEMADQVPEEVKEERRDELMELQQEISYDRGQDRIGQELLVMIEGKVADESAYIGRTYGDAPKVDGYIFVQTGELLMTGDFAKVRVTGALEYDLIGVLSDEYTE